MEKQTQEKDLRDQREEALELDDERRVKVLSPTALVMKRFFRNKLAIVGLCILVIMFIFSFIGPLFYPYGETEVFKEYNYIQKDYAAASTNKEYRYSIAENADFPAAAQSKFILAVNNEENIYTSGDISYLWELKDESFYLISELEEYGYATYKAKRFTYKGIDEEKLDSEITAAFEEAIAAEETQFTVGDTTYHYAREDLTYVIYTAVESAIASYMVYDFEDEAEVVSYAYRYASETAITSGESSFEVNGMIYDLVIADEDFYLVYQGDEVVANISKLMITPASSDVFLDLGYKAALREAIANGDSAFYYTDADGEEVEYTLKLSNNQYTVKAETYTLLITDYQKPSLAHPLGTDANGMDLLVRLMYGGQISLLIGFIVMLIAVVIGIVLGGIAGYFGKWIDMVIMRLVDIFNCIPYLPLMIILGAVMDTMRVNVRVRIFYLMLIMGILEWPTIARLIRGQILSLREQEFMVATEATGISARHRIFRHLIPNVIPQIIVRATLGLGGAILMESTLSFLGLGVKHPYASWGNIVNAVNNVHVMTNYWFAWIPAGFCILITVLGFNFVGDGLRDAFDPKMKR